MSVEAHRASAPARIRYALITISDTRDLATDKGGAYLVEAITAAGHEVVSRAICRDDSAAIERAVRAAVAAPEVDLVVTTGGTGISARDVTFPTLERLFDSAIPGFGELFRWLSHAEVGSATILSRATAGLIGRKVVLALPGSPRALRLAMEQIVLKEAGHLVAQSRA
jgi:molybdenum cofactor biosynthesis protein B